MTPEERIAGYLDTVAEELEELVVELADVVEELPEGAGRGRLIIARGQLAIVSLGLRHASKDLDGPDSKG